MGRIYLALEVDFDNDEKVARLSRYAKAGEARACRDLLVAMWRYCKAERTDGHVPFEIVGKLCYPDPVRLGIRDADRLVEVGLAERTETGYFFGKFLKRNKSKAEIEALAQKKADAGRIGGLASGLSRKGEADGKQPASTPRSHTYTPTHLTPDTSISDSSFEGERPVTLHAVPATEPPPKNPADARCSGHRGVADPGPCNGCRLARERAERQLAHTLERDRLAAEAAARDCTRCDGTWEVDDNRDPTRRKCDHTRRTA
jgi:hypothetical protein